MIRAFYKCRVRASPRTQRFGLLREENKGQNKQNKEAKQDRPTLRLPSL